MPKDPSRTELPTPKRIEDARKEGKVLTSEEVNSLAVTIGGGVLMLPTAIMARDGFGNTLRYCLLDIDWQGDWSLAAISHGIGLATLQFGILLAPFLGGICIIAIASNRLQTGHYLEPGAMAFKPEQLSPVTGMKQVIPSADNMMKLVLILLKLIVIGGLVYLMVKRDLETIAWLPLQGLANGTAWVFEHFISVAAAILTLLTAVAVADYLWRRKQYIDNLMMTKQEVKDEHKNMDGDPHIKGRLRQRMRELSMMRLITEVPRADVIIANPIHVAVALRYQPGEMAPMVVAKGLRKRALRIKELARRSGVPVVEAPPLARAIYRSTASGAVIPPHLYGAVAAILARIYQRRHRNLQPAGNRVA